MLIPGYALLGLIGTLTSLWLLSLVLRDSSIADLFWGLGFVGLAVAYFTLFSSHTSGAKVLLLLVIIWGLRLFIHLSIRNLGKGEDFRYAQWRVEHGAIWWWRSFFQVFLLQGLLLWIIALVFVPALSRTIDWAWTDYLGLLIWAIGLFFEAVGDWQLMQFRRKPTNKGNVLDTGLWRYTRHPNYFGDAMVWWGFYCFALAHPYGLYFVFCPALMTFLLLRVSGVAMLESSLKETKPQYAEYIRRTPAFFPWWPRG
ncbi:MAG: DUF1295 domain-containing protein [Bacteroidota bacterium]